MGTSFRERLAEAEINMIEATDHYKKIRASCTHKGEKTWKSKAGRYYCEDCETFLPRPLRRRHEDRKKV